jgi:hypothetical protein
MKEAFLFFIHALVYLSAILLAIVCIYTANNMSEKTCHCIRNCFYLIVAGLLGMVLAVYYEWDKWLSMLAMLPIVWGITGWLMFDRYRAHEHIGRIYDQLRNLLRRLKES